MNITFILGNGFDLNFELPTNYSDFYEYYCGIETKDSSIAALKQAIKENAKDLWSDFEVAFGLHTEHISTIDELDKIAKDVIYHLMIYMKKVNEEVFSRTITPITVEKMKKDLCLYNPYLTDSENTAVKNFINTLRGTNIVNFLTFNYTQTMERILSEFPDKEIMKVNGIPFQKGELIYVHGKITDEVVITGVNDESQVSNKKLLQNDLGRFRLIKNVMNEQLGFDNHKKALSILNQSHLIVIFGHSLGITDNLWWHSIGQWLNSPSDHRCIYYEYYNDEKKKDILNRMDLRAEIIKVRDFVFKRMGFSAPDAKLKNRLYVTINSGMFKS